MPPGTAEFVKATCQDLTQFLAGDAIKDYPNLAAIPKYAWSNSSCVIDGALYSWPIHRYLPGLSYFFKNTDMWNQKVGADTSPADVWGITRCCHRPTRTVALAAANALLRPNRKCMFASVTASPCAPVGRRPSWRLAALAAAWTRAGRTRDSKSFAAPAKEYGSRA